jgi:hypothetical protein
MRALGKHIKKLSAGLLALCVAHSAQAVAVACTYKVTRVSLNPAGWVYASFAPAGGASALDYVLLCNVDAAAPGIPTSSCKSILATLLLAKSSQTNVLMWFDQPTAFNCNSTLAWVNLREAAGWYFGPSLE